MGAVDLHQLAQACSPGARAVHALRAASLGLPQPGPDHPAAQLVHAEAKDVLARKVLVGQLRSEVGVVPAHQLHAVRLLRVVDAPVAALASSARDQPLRAVLAYPAYRPFDLMSRHVQLLGRLRLRQPSVLQVPQYLQTLHYVLNHQLVPCRHQRPADSLKGTLLLGAEGALLSWGHTTVGAETVLLQSRPTGGL